MKHTYFMVIIMIMVISFAVTLHTKRSLVSQTIPAPSLTIHQQNVPLKKIDTAHPVMLVIMVKDEAHVMEKTLESYVKGGIDTFIIYDTGSTDQTMQKAQKYLEKHNITRYAMTQDPFVNFEVSRNRALDFAREKFPEVPFVVMPDAEWHMKNVEKLITFCREHVQATEPTYLVRILFGTADYYVTRLIRNNGSGRFIGVVHECACPNSNVKVPNDVVFVVESTRQGQEKSAQRWKRDLGLLLTEHEKNPTAPRTLFYLAQTYDCLDDLENAYKYYKKRIRIDGWIEENFMARYRLAQVCERLAKKYPQKTKWKMRTVYYYLDAFAYRSQRAEPLIRLAHWYLAQEVHSLSFILANRASQIPYPTDILFVEKRAYEYSRWDILGRSAWFENEYTIGQYAITKALEAEPHAHHLRYNQACYQVKNHSYATT